MITREEILKVGEIAKIHGLNGELVLSFTNDSFLDEKIEFFVVDMDGIFVPFSIEEIRSVTDSKAIITLKDIQSAEDGKLLLKHEVYILIDEVEEIDALVAEKGVMDYFIGYTVVCGTTSIGVITDVNEQTINTLFLIEKENGEEVYIPATKDIIVDTDDNIKQIRLELPEGLLDIND